MVAGGEAVLTPRPKANNINSITVQSLPRHLPETAEPHMKDIPPDIMEPLKKLVGAVARHAVREDHARAMRHLKRKGREKAFC